MIRPSSAVLCRTHVAGVSRVGALAPRMAWEALRRVENPASGRTPSGRPGTGGSGGELGGIAGRAALGLGYRPLLEALEDPVDHRRAGEEGDAPHQVPAPAVATRGVLYRRAAAPPTLDSRHRLLRLTHLPDELSQEIDADSLEESGGAVRSRLFPAAGLPTQDSGPHHRRPSCVPSCSCRPH